MENNTKKESLILSFRVHLPLKGCMKKKTIDRTSREISCYSRLNSRESIARNYSKNSGGRSFMETLYASYFIAHLPIHITWLTKAYLRFITQNFYLIQRNFSR